MLRPVPFSIAVAVAVLAVAACTPGEQADAGDASVAENDPGRSDGGPHHDAGAAGLDAGARDSGPPDSGMPDSGMPDGGMADSGIADAGAPDSGMPDVGEPDAGELPDTTRPAAPEVDSPPSLISTPTLALTGTKEAGSGIRFGGVEVVSVDDATTWAADAALVEGTNTLLVTAFDSANNESEPVTITIELDTTPPAAPVVDPPESPTREPSVTLSGEKEAETAILLDDEVGVPLDDETTWQTSVTLVEGSNVFTLAARDAAGNVSAPVEVTIELDVTGPTLDETSPAADATGVALDATIQLTFSEPVVVPEGAISVTDGTDAVEGAWSVVDATATFTPATSLLLETTYTVTVTTAVTDLPGNALAEETSFELTTRAGQWSMAADLPGGESGWNPSLAMNDSGRAILAWEIGNADVYAAIFDPASGWSEPELLDVPELGAASKPAAAIDPAGVAHVVWRQAGAVAVPTHIYVRRLAPGEEWSDPVRVSHQSGYDYPESPAITVDFEGSATVAWTAEWFTSTSVAAVFMARMPGGDWTVGSTFPQQVGQQFTLSSRAKPTRISIGVDAYTDGVRPRTVAVWEHGIYVVGNHADPSFSTSTQVDLGSQNRATYPALAVAPNGVALATWFLDDKSGTDLDYPRYSVFRPGSGWSAKKGLGTFDRVIEPVVALDENAHGLVAFLGEDLSNRAVVHAGVYRDNGVDAGAILTTSLYTGTQASLVQVAARDGRGLVAYQRVAADSSKAMVVRTVDLATSAISDEVVVDSSADNANFPRLGLDSAGHALLVWRDGTRLVWSRYE